MNPIECHCCDGELSAEESHDPHHDCTGHPVCNSCYQMDNQDVCDRCDRAVDNIELDMNPGHLLAVWVKTADLAPGYYRVTSTPVYRYGRLGSLPDPAALEFCSDLDLQGKAALNTRWTDIGSLCLTCRTQIEGK